MGSNVQNKWQMIVSEVPRGGRSEMEKKLRDLMAIRGETAARHPLLGLDPIIPFSCQEKAQVNPTGTTTGK